MATVVHQGVDRFLQHPLFVTDDDLRGLQLQQIAQTVVTIDHPTIEVVQIGGGKTATFQRNQRTEIRRNDRKDFENHPLGAGPGVDKALHQLHSLGNFLAGLLAACGFELLFEFDSHFVQIHFFENIPDRLCTHLGNKRIPELLLGFPILGFGQKLLFLQRSLPWIDHEVILVVDHPFQFPCRHIHHQTEPARHALVEPDVADRHRQLNVPHAFTTNPGQRDLHTATITDHPLELDSLVLSTRALVILGRSENPLAEQPTLLRLEGPVVDGLGIFGFPAAPGKNRFGRRDGDAHLVEADGSFHAEDFTCGLGLFVHGMDVFQLG